MAFNPNIKYNPLLSSEDNFKALFNWLNFALREMTVGRVPRAKDDADKTAGVVSAQLGGVADEKTAEQFRFALQKFAATLSEKEAMEIATIYDPWEIGKDYKGGEYFTYGTNAVGDPQLYRVNDGKPHKSQEDWPPDKQPDLYTAIGLDESGHPVWAQPTGAHDDYDKGDIVNHNGTLYISNINGNATVPGTDERWWSEYKEAM